MAARLNWLNPLCGCSVVSGSETGRVSSLLKSAGISSSAVPPPQRWNNALKASGQRHKIQHTDTLDKIWPFVVDWFVSIEHTFIDSSVRSLICSFVHSIILAECSSVCRTERSFICSFAWPLFHSFALSLVCLFIQFYLLWRLVMKWSFHEAILCNWWA